MSQALINIEEGSNGRTIPTAAIAGEMDSRNRSLLKHEAVFEYFSVLGCSSNPLVQDLTAMGWATTFNQHPNDAIVAVRSQLNDARNDEIGIIGFGVVHSSGAESLGFSGPNELSNSYIASQVVVLLNYSLTESPNLWFRDLR